MNAGYTTLLEETLEYWRGVRHGLIDEAENIPEAHYGFRPTPQSRTVTELLIHCIEAGLMMAGELTRPDGDFTRRPYADHVREYAAHLPPAPSRSELLALLRSTHEDGERRIQDAGELFMLQNIRRFDGLSGTRMAWLSSGVGHEYYHCGQLALYARMIGLVPALTQKLEGG